MTRNNVGPRPLLAGLLAAWPWLLIATTVGIAVWHAVDFPDDVDPEYPAVLRPTFSRMPPPAYRLAEPGDTLDRVALYLSAGATILAAIGLYRSKAAQSAWVSAIGLSIAALWYAATPGPTFDGWHGLGWRALADPTASTPIRVGLGVGLVGIILLVVHGGLASIGRFRALWNRAGTLRVRGLLAVAIVGTVFRQFEVPGIEPAGYWPRWGLIWGLLAFDLALARLLIGQGLPSRTVRLAFGLAGSLGWTVLVVSGIHLSWYHRPLERLRTIEPGRIYLSAMPTYAGLRVAYDRHPFRTIINIFPEDTDQRSPILAEEHRFVREHGIHYVEASARDNDSDAFLDQTLKLAVDPDAWPILIHCHGSMDRSPGWMGIYRFLIQGRPLDSIMRELEQHRGYRPKASITLLFNRVLGTRAPAKYLSDPTGRLLLECARGEVMPPRSEIERISRAGETLRRP